MPEAGPGDQGDCLTSGSLSYRAIILAALPHEEMSFPAGGLLEPAQHFSGLHSC